MSTVVEREYTPDITQHIGFAYQSTGLYNKRFYWTVFPIVILENHFYFVDAPDYCFRHSSFRIFCVNNFVKVLFP